MYYARIFNVEKGNHKIVEESRPFFSKQACIDYLNQRIAHWNNKIGWRIPNYEEQQND